MLMDGRRTTDDGRKVMTIAKNGTVYHNIKKIGQSIIILKNGTVYHNIKKMWQSIIILKNGSLS